MYGLRYMHTYTKVGYFQPIESGLVFLSLYFDLYCLTTSASTRVNEEIPITLPKDIIFSVYS